MYRKIIIIYLITAINKAKIIFNLFVSSIKKLIMIYIGKLNY